MTRIQRLMKLHRLYEPAGEHGSVQDGGTGTGDSGADEAAAAAAAEAEAAAAAAAAEAAAKGNKTDLTDGDAALLKDVMKLKEKSKNLQTELAQAKAALENFSGIDPVKARELVAAQEEAERKAAEARGEYDRLIKQMGDRHIEDKARLEAALQAERAGTKTLSQQIAELTVGAAFSTSKTMEGLNLTPAKARIIYGSHFEFVDGKVVGYDKPTGASERTLLVNSAGEALAFDEALDKLVDADPDREHLRKSKAKQGAGSTTTAKGGRKAIEQVEADRKSQKMTPAQKISAGLKALAEGK